MDLEHQGKSFFNTAKLVSYGKFIFFGHVDFGSVSRCIREPSQILSSKALLER